MIKNASFQRKVIYLACIALLLIPLYMIGNPATGDPSRADSTPGGKLAQLRAEYDLSPAELGEIDPTSETMRLATLGMRTVAANILWHKANEHRKKEHWVQLAAVVNQLVKLQPHFTSVWEFQAHNLSYNISVDQDDYRFRYLWVKKGIDLMIDGTRYNRREPKLFWTVGWYMGQKMGVADERAQFRRLFGDDEDFHEHLNAHVPVDGEGRGASGKPDNWLVSKLWYDKAYDIIDTQGVPLRGKSPHIFYADGPKSLMNYASAIEIEGYLDEKAEYAWQRAGVEWGIFGDKLFPSTWGEYLRLAEQEAKAEEAVRLVEELKALVPTARDEIRAEKITTLSPDEREALDVGYGIPDDQLQYQLFMQAGQKVSVSYLEMAERAPAEVRAKAHRLAVTAKAAETTVDRIERYRDNVNFDYWRTRCRVEQLPETVKARRHIYQANQFMDEVLLDEARHEYEEAWVEWDSLLVRNPDLMRQLTADDLLEDVLRYLTLLDQLDETLPEDFALRRLLEIHGSLRRQTEEEPVDESAQP
jgi:hypothetical protein